MKILRIDNPASVAAADAVLIADSAWRPDRRPLFLPEEGDGSLFGELRMALRVDRLGKCVSARFARRYIGAMSVVATFSGPSMTPFSDDSLVTGRWIDLGPDDKPAMTVTTDVADSPVSIAADEAYIDSLFESLSRRTTFKTGDIIILPVTVARFDPALFRQVTVDAGDTNLLEFPIR